MRYAIQEISYEDAVAQRCLVRVLGSEARTTDFTGPMFDEDGASSAKQPPSEGSYTWRGLLNDACADAWLYGIDNSRDLSLSALNVVFASGTALPPGVALGSAYIAASDAQEFIGVIPPTSELQQTELMTQRLERILAAGREEVFEDGIATPFSIAMEWFLSQYGAEAIRVLSDYRAAGKILDGVFAEILRIAGVEHNRQLQDVQLKFLLTSLTDASPIIRDGALVGLGYLNNKAAITPLRLAASRETVPELKADMMEVLHDLEG